MKPLLCHITVAVCVWAIATDCAARETSRQTALPLPPRDMAVEQLLADAVDGRLDRHDLLSAWLIASGVTDPRQVARCQAQAAAWRAAWQQAEQLAAAEHRSFERNALARPARLHRFLHGTLLTGDYRHDASSPVDTVENGQYNCVSATLWWLWLADETLEQCDPARPFAVEKPGHVCVAWQLAGQRCEIEATAADWHRALTVVHPDAPPTGRDVPATGLLAMVLYNRGLDRLESREFAAAVAANRQALALDGASAAARHNLLAAYNAWALDEFQAGRYAQSYRVFSAALGEGFQDHTLAINAALVLERWAAELQGPAAPLAAVALRAEAQRLSPRRPDGDAWLLDAAAQLAPMARPL